MNDQTPTPETDANKIEVRVHGGFMSVADIDFARTLERQRDTLRAEVDRLTNERNHQNQQACAWAMKCGQLEKRLATMRATRDTDHGAAIEAAAYRLFYARGLVNIGFHELKRELRALVATVTNFQQKPDAQPTKAGTTNMNIGQVIEALKQGKHARRAGWNGKRMHIYMEEGKQRMVGSAMQRTEEPYLVLFTAAQTHQPGWNASTPDLLSDDWEILEAHETDYPR